MTNILFVSPTGTLDNGAEISIVNLMKMLVEKGHKVVNVVPGYSKSITNYEQECINNKITMYYVDAIKWWWEDAPGEVFGTDIERAQSYRQAIHDIADIITLEKIDLVITNTVNVFVGSIAAACQEIPHYWLIHEFPKNEFSYYESKIDFISENTDKIFSVGGELKNNLNELFLPKEVNSFFPYSELTRSILKEGKVSRIVNVGRVSSRKNQLELIKAFKNMQNKNVELVFIGGEDESYKKVCLEYINKNNLKNIRFLGHLDHPWNEITDKDVCVFTSSMETFGLVYVEAVLNGIPTIFSDNPGHTSAFDLVKGGHMYPLGNLELLTKKMDSILNDFKKEQDLSNEQKLYAFEVYSPEMLYKNIIDSIENLEYAPKSIRHVKNLLLKNELKTKVSTVESKSRIFIQKVKRKISQQINNKF